MLVGYFKDYHRLGRSREEAEEILQETFLEMLRSIRSYRGEGAFGAWLRRITISKALTALRRGRQENSHTGTTSDIPETEQPVSSSLNIYIRR